MFNPNPHIETVRITPRHACVVIDDALSDPDAWVERAARHFAAFRDAPHNAYPGPELPLPDAVTVQLHACFARHARATLGARRTLRSHSRLSLTTRSPDQLQPRQWLPHVDRLEAVAGQCIAACVLYLFRDESLGGTSFYRPRHPLPEIARLVQDSARLDAAAFSARYHIAPGYPDAGAWFDKLATIPARHNRLIFYEGTVFHAGEIRTPERLTGDPRTGRLTLNGFFLCRRNAAWPATPPL
jgi:hypothetical protein